MIEILKSKINKIIDACPGINDFLDEGFDLEYAKEISNDFKIRLKDNFNGNVNDDLATLFKKNVEYKNFSFFGFTLNEFEEHKDFIHIGNQDVNLLVVIKKTQKVALLDFNTFDIIAYISNDFIEFLDIISILVAYSKIGYLGKTYTDEIKEKTLSELEKIPLNKEILSYYSKSIPK